MLIQIKSDNSLHVRVLLTVFMGDFANFQLKLFWSWYGYKNGQYNLL